MKHIYNYKKFFEAGEFLNDSEKNDVISADALNAYKTKDGVLKIRAIFRLEFNDDILLIDMHKLEGILLERWQGFINLLARANRITANYKGVLEINGAKILYVAVANHDSRTYYPRTNLNYSGSGCYFEQHGTEYPMLGVLLLSDLPKICDAREMENIIQSGVILHNYNDIMSTDSNGNLISNSAILYTDSSHDKCDECGGHGTKICKLCKGSGSFKCENCIRGTIKCETCDGSAKLEDGIECFECDDGRVYCEFCKGGGFILCKDCAGSGSNECEKCHGSGAINVDKILSLKN